MTRTFNEQYIDEFMKKWCTLGWMAWTGDLYDGHIDIEQLIVETTHLGRRVDLHDGRVFKWFLTWVRDYHDLINAKRLIRLLPQADTAVLGAVLAIAIENGANPNLRTIIRKCKPHKTPQLLFTGIKDELGIFEKQEKAGGHKMYKKWGLYCTMLQFYDDAQRPRNWVLERNPILALRAIIGPNVRSEIIHALTIRPGIAIRSLAKEIGYAYSCVHNDVQNLIKSEFITSSAEGISLILELTPKTQKLLRAI